MFKPFRALLNQAIVDFLLKLHNFSYRLVGTFSQKLEKDNLHPKHRLTDYHRWFVSKLKPEWKILDVGCGVGVLTNELARHCKCAVGIDICAENIRKAVKCENTEFICADVTKFLPKTKFDAIVLSNVLEHIEDRQSFLLSLTNLAPILLIRVPMLDRDWLTLYKKERGIEHRLDFGHFTEYTFDSFSDEMARAGLKFEDYRIRYGELYAVARKREDYVEADKR